MILEENTKYKFNNLYMNNEREMRNFKFSISPTNEIFYVIVMKLFD